MISDTQGHRSRISALRELLVDARVIKRTRKTISNIQGRRSSISAVDELIVDGPIIHWPQNMISGIQEQSICKPPSCWSS
jgi:hypothetical protein